jgi:uncharacterized membrane protein YcaP (DUF421 family)
VDIIVRTVIIYIFIVLGIRLFGKRELAQLSVVDLVFILLISNSVQNAMVGNNTTLWGGVIAAGSLFVVNLVLETLFFKSRKFSRFIQGSPLMLVYSGKIIKKHLDEAKLSQDELEEAVREHGIEKISDVDLAILETDGNISVLSQNFQHRTVRKRRAHKILSKSS